MKENTMPSESTTTPAKKFYQQIWAGNSLQARLMRAFLPSLAAIFVLESILDIIWLILPSAPINHTIWSLGVTLLVGGLFSVALWRITKNIGDELETTQTNLQISEKRFRSVIEQSLEGMVLTDEAGRITHWNAVQEAISQLPAAEAIGRFIWDVQFEYGADDSHTPERLETLKRMSTRMLEGGPSATLGHPAELPMHRPDGSSIVVQSLTFPIATDKGHILCGIVRDITRSKQAEEALFWELAENAALSNLYKPLIAANTTLDVVAHTILEQAQSLTGSEHGYVSVIDPLTKKNVGYTLTAMMDTCNIEGEEKHISFDPDENGSYPGLWGAALNTRQAFYTNNVPSHPAVRGTPQGHIPLQQFLSMPVLLDDELVGQIALANPGRDYSSHDLEAAKRLGEYFALAIQRSRIEDALKAEHNNLLKIFQAAPVGMLLLDANTLIVDANPALGNIILREPAEIIGKRGGGGLQCIHSFEDPRGCGFSHSCPVCPLRNGVQSVLSKGNSIHDEEVCITLLINGKPTDRWLSVSAEPLQIDHQPHVIVAIDDITERKAAENTLQLSEQRYRGLFDHLQEGAALHEIICDKAGKPVNYRFLEINPAFEKLVGLKAADILGKTVLEVMPQTERYWIETYGQVAITGKPLMMENFARATERWYQVSAYSPRSGQFAVTFEDITERKQHDMYVEKTLKEKDVLLKEIHHRVKNNLQIINSLLNLHAETIVDPAALQAFQDCQNNVRAIALVHEHLYRSDSLAEIEASEYMPGLLKHLQVAAGRQASHIHLDVQVEPCKIDLDTAIPCGLILTELFTNTHKHAFPVDFAPTEQTQQERVAPQVRVQFVESASEYCLTVQDNGIGLPAEIQRHEFHSMGLQLVGMLTQQLQGKLVIENENGAMFRVVFPKMIGT
jgi:PAS domain S-box-containing protein